MDVLAFYSDGVLEAINDNNEMYGEERFHNVLAGHATKNAQQIRDGILDEISGFRGEALQNDDIALVIIKCLK